MARQKMEIGPSLKKWMSKYDTDGEMRKSMEDGEAVHDAMQEDEEYDGHEASETEEDEEVEEEALKKFKKKVK